MVSRSVGFPTKRRTWGRRVQLQGNWSQRGDPKNLNHLRRRGRDRVEVQRVEDEVRRWRGGGEGGGRGRGRGGGGGRRRKGFPLELIQV